jgi:predicted outer membrane repeat protein
MPFEWRQAHRHSARPLSWTRIGTSTLLIATALAGGYATANPAHAAPDLCSTEIGQPIDNPAAFNLAVAEINNTGDCNVIDIASGFTFTTPPNRIEPYADLTALTLAGPSGGAILNGNNNSGIRIDFFNDADLDVVVDDLAFTQFDGTVAGAQGQAALEVHASDPLTANLTDVAFLSNDGEVAGGLHIQGSDTVDVALTGTVTFTNNSATVGAGALSVDNTSTDSSLTLGTDGGTDVINFQGNTSTAQSGGIQADRVTIWGGTFTSNSTTTSGGAISARTVTLNDVDFALNSAGGNEGGAVHSTGLVTVHGGTFDNNYATDANGAGGAISTGGSITVDQGAVFTDNTAGGFGGAISALSDATIEGSTFERNLADYGAAVAASRDVTVESSSFADQEALFAGGAVHSFMSITSSDSDYLSNEAGLSGGALWTGYGDVSTTDDTFTLNLATGFDAGAVGALSVLSEGATFDDNSAGRDGGAVWTRTITDSGSSFTGNTAGTKGGAVSVSPANPPVTSTFTGSSFQDGSADEGGAIQSGGPLTLAGPNCSFADNASTTNGGAINVGGTTSISGCTFARNVASDIAGAVFLTGGASGQIADSVFEDNEALGLSAGTEGNGGAIVASGPLTVLTSAFTGNAAEIDGGAISAESTLGIDEATFADNDSRGGNGGALHVANANATITASTFSGNSSLVGNGGAIWGGVGAAVSITDSTLSTNSSANWGGAVFANADVTVGGSVFSSNTATVRGGAIHVEDSATVTESTFAGNTIGSTGYGGALSVIDHLTLTRSTIRDGGGAFIGGGFSAGTVSITSSSITGNQATNGGGGFIATRGDILNSTFWGNQSAIGGALMFNFDDPNPSKIILSTLAGNTSNASQASAIASPPNVTIELIGSALEGVNPVCSDDIGPAHLPLDLAPDASYSFATDDSCGTGPGIDTDSSTLAELGLAGALTTDSTPGMQVDLPTNASVLNATVPLSALSGLPGPLKDQLGALRNSPNGLTSAGSVQVRPLSISGPSSSTVAAGSSAAFTVAATPGLGPTLAYQWQRSLGGAPWTDITANASAQTASLVLPQVSLNESGLLLRVRVSDMRNTAFSGTAALTVIDPTPPTPPSAPLGVRATAGESRAIVTWQAPSSSGSAPVTSYEVRNDVDSQVCVVAVSAKLECTMTGLSPGRAYRFSVRARSAVDWGLWSQWSTAVTPLPVGATITIRGTRKGNEVIVTGSTTGLEGKRVRAMVRFGSERDYARGSLRPIREDGGFTWKLTTRKAVHIYFTHADVRSRAVTIEARPRR